MEWNGIEYKVNKANVDSCELVSKEFAIGLQSDNDRLLNIIDTLKENMRKDIQSFISERKELRDGISQLLADNNRGTSGRLIVSVGLENKLKELQKKYISK